MKNISVVFWDFDGVIKDSVEVKTNAFVDLFKKFGPAFSSKIKKHHLANGGMSRFEKIPLYAKWVGLNLDEKGLYEYSKKFSDLVVKKVIESDWVDGVERILRENPLFQKFILVSATPEKELLYILDALDLRKCFINVYGSPVSKKDAIKKSINQIKISNKKCLMIGDAQADMLGALDNNVLFLLRTHKHNKLMLKNFSGQTILNFINYESIFKD